MRAPNTGLPSTEVDADLDLVTRRDPTARPLRESCGRRESEHESGYLPRDSSSEGIDRTRHLVGWGGRIRTFNLLIQSQLRYRCATPQIRARRRTILRTGSNSPTRAGW